MDITSVFIHLQEARPRGSYFQKRLREHTVSRSYAINYADDDYTEHTRAERRTRERAAALSFPRPFIGLVIV